jgi:hypothetical protein
VNNKYVLSYSTLVAEKQNVSAFSVAPCINKTLRKSNVKLEQNDPENQWQNSLNLRLPLLHSGDIFLDLPPYIILPYSINCFFILKQKTLSHSFVLH